MNISRRSFRYLYSRSFCTDGSHGQRFGNAPPQYSADDVPRIVTLSSRNTSPRRLRMRTSTSSIKLLSVYRTCRRTTIRRPKYLSKLLNSYYRSSPSGSSHTSPKPRGSVTYPLSSDAQDSLIPSPPPLSGAVPCAPREIVDHSWIRSFQVEDSATEYSNRYIPGRLQKILGLSDEVPLSAGLLDGSLASDGSRNAFLYDQSEDPLLICIDFDNIKSLVQEFRTGKPRNDVMPEVGISIFDCESLVEGSSSIPWKTHNFCIGSASSFQAKHSHNFRFGRTQLIPRPADVAKYIEPLIDRSRRIFLVGHSIKADLEVMKVLGFDTKTSVVGIVDTFFEATVLWYNPLNKVPGLGYTLRSVLRRFGYNAKFTHTAGNDANYTLRALMLIARLPYHRSGQHFDEETTRRLRLLENFVFPKQGNSADRSKSERLREQKRLELAIAVAQGGSTAETTKIDHPGRFVAVGTSSSSSLQSPSGLHGSPSGAHDHGEFRIEINGRLDANSPDGFHSVVSGHVDTEGSNEFDFAVHGRLGSAGVHAFNVNITKRDTFSSFTNNAIRSPTTSPVRRRARRRARSPASNPHPNKKSSNREIRDPNPSSNRISTRGELPMYPGTRHLNLSPSTTSTVPTWPPPNGLPPP